MLRRHQLLGLLAAGLAVAARVAAAAAVSVTEEVPFITTPDHVTVAMLELAGVGPHDHVIDLGSGDGRIVITAARRFGARGTGVEIVPDLVARSVENARRAGVADRTDFREQDLFQTDLSPATVVTMYLLPEVNLQLRPRLLALAPGTRIVSHDWDLGDWRPDRTLTLSAPDKRIGLEKVSRLHLWTVPARVHGLWCGQAGLALRLEQQYQRLTGELTLGQERRSLVGIADGARLRALAEGGAAWSAQAAGDVLQIVEAAGLPGLRGRHLRRASGAACP